MVDGASNTADTIKEVVALGVQVEPLVVELISAIKRHMDANNGVFPTPDEVMAQLAQDTEDLKAIWSAWTAQHPDPAATSDKPSGPSSL